MVHMKQKYEDRVARMQTLSGSGHTKWDAADLRPDEIQHRRGNYRNFESATYNDDNFFTHYSNQVPGNENLDP